MMLGRLIVMMCCFLVVLVDFWHFVSPGKSLFDNCATRRGASPSPFALGQMVRAPAKAKIEARRDREPGDNQGSTHDLSAITRQSSERRWTHEALNFHQLRTLGNRGGLGRPFSFSHQLGQSGDDL
jgi:hypothetical protein